MYRALKNDSAYGLCGLGTHTHTHTHTRARARARVSVAVPDWGLVWFVSFFSSMQVASAQIYACASLLSDNFQSADREREREGEVVRGRWAKNL